MYLWLVCGALIAIGLLLWRIYATLSLPRAQDRPVGSPTRLAIVLGSGGHTAELLSSLQSLPTSRYTHRTYIVSSGDSFSSEKAVAFEKGLEGLAELRRKPYGTYDIAVVPRARRVHQSLLTTPWSCVQCWMASLRVLGTASKGYQRQWQSYVSRGQHTAQDRELLRLGITPYPDLIVTNGPATGLLVVLAALSLRFSGLGRPRHHVDGGGGMRSIFVESWARVRSLSLTGRILLATGACQKVIVQWEGLRVLAGSGSSVSYIGPVVK